MKDAHIKRWEVAAAFLANVIAIVVVTIYLTNDVRRNTHTLRIIQDTHATLSEIQQTNCGLKKFLLETRVNKLADSRQEKDGEKKDDLEAAQRYLKLANSFSFEATGHCVIK